MAAVFDCPKCGAPLDFDPKPGDETVECSFCHEVVIIPKDLRIPLPRKVVDRHPQKPAGGMNRLIIVFAIIGVLAVCIFGVTVLSASDKPAADTPTDYPADLSVDTETPDLSSATSTVEAKATVDALQPILKLEQSWPATFTENFVDNSHEWQTGDVRDSYITGNRSISKGVYTWNITSVQSASDFSFPNMANQTDFFASVDMKYTFIADDPDADAGMVFRYSSADQTWYYFSVNDKGQFYLGLYDGKSWSTLIPETDSPAIHVGETNHLSVGAQGSQFIFLINGQMVDHFVDENLKSGVIGVGVNLPKTGEKANVEFSNLMVLSAPK